MFGFARRTAVCLIVAAFGSAAASIVPGSQIAFGADSKPGDGISLTIDEKDQASAIGDGQLIILLNCKTSVRSSIGTMMPSKR
jgi:hypothetical protein